MNPKLLLVFALILNVVFFALESQAFITEGGGERRQKIQRKLHGVSF